MTELGSRRASFLTTARWRAALRRPQVVTPVLMLALAVVVPTSTSAFTDETANGPNSFSTAAAFPTYPAMVGTDGAQFQHRSDDAASRSTASSAADSSGNALPGTYAGATNGPSTWYKFDDGSGTTTADSSGAANPGTRNNGPTWSGGHTGTGGMTFDGVNDFVASTAPAVDSSTSFSVSAWAHLTDHSGHRTIVSQDGVNASAFFLKYEPTGKRWQFTAYDSDDHDGSGGKLTSSPAAAVLNRWTHLTAVYNDATNLMSLYVDGALVDTASKTLDWSSAGSLIVGGARWGANTRKDYFKGSIDDVQTFRRALTGVEVSQLYAKPSTWWTFDTAHVNQSDSSGHNNTGTLAGPETFVNKGVVLDGSSNYVTGTRRGMHTDRSFSVAAWVYPTSTTGVMTVASQPGTTASAFTLTSNAGVWEFTVNGSDIGSPSSATASASTPATANTLAFVAAVYSDEADELRIFVNGVLEATASMASDFDASGVLNVGRLRSGGTYSGLFAGRIDDLKVYDHALTRDDVFDVYATPLARYDFEENSAVTAIDGSGNGHTATKASGTHTWNSSSHRGASLGFSGASYSSTAAGVVDTTTSYSVSAWVHLSATGGGNKVAVSQFGSDTSPFQLLYHNAGGENTWAFVTRPTDSTAVGFAAYSSVTAVSNRWVHLVGVYDDDADEVRIYVNGALTGSAPATSDFASSGALTLGAGIYGASVGTCWTGSLDEVAVYQRVLTGTEAALLHDVSPHIRYDLNETVGTTAADRSGGNVTGTLFNGPTWAVGKSGNALSFDGVDDNVVSATNSTIATDSSFSVAAWVNMSDVSQTHTAVGQYGTDYYNYMLGYSADSDRWVFSLSDSDGVDPVVTAATSLASPALNTWVHLVGVYDDRNDRAELYVNGVLEGTVTKTNDWNAPAPFVMSLTKHNGNYVWPWVGRIDEVYAYQRALRHREVQELQGLLNSVPAATNVHVPTMTADLPGALQGAQQGQQGSTAIAFNGTSNAYNPTQYNNPTTFSVEAWFRATGTTGGALFGFSVPKTGNGSQRDRLVYLDSAGKLTFGVYVGYLATVRSTAAYNDGAWHHVVATLGPAGMRLHVDGVRVAADDAVTSAENFAGYWRWGGVDILGWPDRPANDYFTGLLDEIAVYPGQLTDNQVARHYAANH